MFGPASFLSFGPTFHSLPSPLRAFYRGPHLPGTWLFWEVDAQGWEAPSTRTETALVISNTGCKTGGVTDGPGCEEDNAQEAASHQQESRCMGDGMHRAQASPQKPLEAPRAYWGRNWSPK